MLNVCMCVYNICNIIHIFFFLLQFFIYYPILKTLDYYEILYCVFMASTKWDVVEVVPKEQNGLVEDKINLFLKCNRNVGRS